MTTITLQVDLKKNDQELSLAVASQCASLGGVRSIKIHRNPTPFALVEMANQYQTLELAGQYGGSAFGSCALIHLEQEIKVA